MCKQPQRSGPHYTGVDCIPNTTQDQETQSKTCEDPLQISSADGLHPFPPNRPNLMLHPLPPSKSLVPPSDHSLGHRRRRALLPALLPPPLARRLGDGRSACRLCGWRRRGGVARRRGGVARGRSAAEAKAVGGRAAGRGAAEVPPGVNKEYYVRGGEVNRSAERFH